MSEDSDEMIIETEGVKVNFGDFWALKGIDINVRKGEIIVILGPSGSGKSTYIRTLNRLQPHSGGTIKIDGITIDEDKLQAMVGEPRPYLAQFDPDDGSVVYW